MILENKKEYQFECKELLQIDDESFSYDSIHQIIDENYESSSSFQSRSFDTDEIEVQQKA